MCPEMRTETRKIQVTEMREEERKAREHVEAFGKGGKAMKELARRYGDILAETEEVKGEIAQLEGQ